jgi:hypothetical protein
MDRSDPGFTTEQEVRGIVGAKYAIITVYHY